MERFELIRELLIADRSVRRFDSSRKLSEDFLKKLVELTRYCASGANLQPLRYRLVIEESECDLLFPSLAWAGYLPDWAGPSERERPVAYLVQCIDTEIGSGQPCDQGLQLQAITLGATAEGIGCCIIKAFKPDSLRNALKLSPRYTPCHVLALGYPAERVEITDVSSNGDIRYFRDENSTHWVPKRPLCDLIIE